MRAPRRSLGLTLALATLGIATPIRAEEAPKKAAGKPGVADAALQAKIDAAVAKGADWLRAQQKASGQLAVVHLGAGGTAYEIGATALAGLALLAAGDKPGDPVVDKAMAYCRAKDKDMAANRRVYDTGVLIMFATKYYTKVEEVKKIKKGGTQDAAALKNPCSMPDDVREWVAAMARYLVEKQKIETGGWGYPETREDFSNTQYALLGLRAAKDCGVPIPPGTWLKALERGLARQEADGPKVKRILGSGDPNGPRYVVESPDRARGWTYTTDDNVVTGSMTTAGIAILQIAHEGLLRPRAFRGYKPSKQLEVAQAIQDGFCWLDINFAVDKNPPEGAPAWHYYYLYGLERACILGGRDLIGEHDWYIDGAHYLLAHQDGSGKWVTGALGAKELEASDILDTAWAILFLKRATRPVEPLPAPVVTR